MQLVEKTINTDSRQYKYYKISRSRSETILNEYEFDLYSKNSVDSNVPKHISANEYSNEYKHTTTPLILIKEKFNNCLSIDDIINTINGIKNNIKNYIKDNRFIRLTLYSTIDNQLCLTYFNVKKVKIRERKNLATEDNTADRITEIFEPNTELEPISNEELLKEYVGYAIIENEGIEGLEKILLWTKIGESVDGETIVNGITTLLADAYKAYEESPYILEKFSVIFLTDDKSYIDAGDKFIGINTIQQMQKP